MINPTKENSRGGQHRQSNRGPAGGDTGQRQVVRVPGSVTPLDYREAIERENNGKEEGLIP